jgi:hypothetical protein
MVKLSTGVVSETNPSGVDKRFLDPEPVRIAMGAGTHSIWISEQIEELGHEVIAANVRELRAISHLSALP